MEFKIYEVGGTIRDRILGLQNKDYDYTVVITGATIQDYGYGFAAMHEYLKSQGFQVFQVHDRVGTIRAKFPKNHAHAGETADFVLARREEYNAHSRTPIVFLGTLADDLLRRDFTVNAMACEENGTIIDMFGGMLDVKRKRLDTPREPWETFNDDPLRALRAVRFTVTKGFWMADRVREALSDPSLVSISKQKVSAERVREELTKAFKFNTLKTLEVLHEDVCKELRDYWLTCGGMWLKPTNEAR